MKEEVKQKRPAIDKQSAYLEFKSGDGSTIEQGILLARKDMKEKRTQTKDLTQKINRVKNLIDKLKEKLDKKEEERKLQQRV